MTWLEFNLFFSDSEVFFKRGTQQIGGQYKKALYFEYTDATFTSKKDKPNHLGFLGPVIRAEVGDTIKVVFKNLVCNNVSCLLSIAGLLGRYFAVSVEDLKLALTFCIDIKARLRTLTSNFIALLKRQSITMNTFLWLQIAAKLPQIRTS